mgnify:CR=1 FL=1
MSTVYERRFNEAYRCLNPRQRQAVDAIMGPVMVMAGPGTGKTEVLTVRIANILRLTDTPPDSILALTFTESAAANLKRRLAELIGSRGYYVSVATFHSFCDSIIKNYPEYFNRIIGGVSIDEIRRLEIVEDILLRAPFREIKPLGNKFFYVRDILSQIARLKKDGFSPQNYSAFLKSQKTSTADSEKKSGASGEATTRRLRRSLELVRVYTAYQRALEKNRWYDFEDMILETVRALSSRSELKAELQERYQYLLVDEHQDTNFAQNRVVDILSQSTDAPNLFVVGDAKQAIYKFQGASLENFLYFKNRYPETRLVSLSENYRSPQLILDAATSLISRHPEASSEEPLLSRPARSGAKVSYAELPDPDREFAFVADRISQLRVEGIPFGDIAVLFRTNKEADNIADVFSRRHLPFLIESDYNLLRHPNIRKLLSLLEAVGNPGDNALLISALHADFLKIPPLDIYLLAEAANKRVPTSVFTLMNNASTLRAAGVAAPSSLISLASRLSSWRQTAEHEEFSSLFETIVRDSGFFSFLLSHPDYLAENAKLSSLFREIKKISASRPHYRLSDFLSYLKRVREHNLLVKTALLPAANAVRLMTAHKAKGLEFSAVFIVNAVDRHWGNKRSAEFFLSPVPANLPRSAAEKNEEERRLFYMALTRAKNRVFISYPHLSTDGRELSPCQFISEIDSALLNNITPLHPPAASAFSPVSPLLARRANEEEYLRRLFLRRGLSATALNNYLECPWKFFYRNLVRLPSAKSPAAAFGSAVHRALGRFFEEQTTGGRVLSARFLTDEFKLALSRELLSDSDRRRLFSKGRRLLPHYFAARRRAWNYLTKNEFRVASIIDNGIHLKGMLDKLELSPGSNLVTVVDYKTGRPQSRNAIEGKTKTSRGDYKRQLVFYQLLLDSYPGRYRASHLALDFIEPTPAGIFKREEFIVSDAELAALKETISRVWNEIINFSFWDRFCDNKHCEYCALRRSLTP